MQRSIEFELEDLNSRPDPEPLLVEMLHDAAFRGGPLANPKLCPLENLTDMKKENLYTYMKHLYKPSRTVLTCIGIDHNEFVQMTKDKFSSVMPIWQENAKLVLEDGKNKDIIDTRKAVWVGGSNLVEKDLSDLNQGSNNQLPVSTIRNDL